MPLVRKRGVSDFSVVDVDYVYDGCYKADGDYDPFTTFVRMEKLYTQVLF